MVALLIFNSFHFPFLHKIIGGLDVLLYRIVIFFFSFSDMKEGKYPSVLMNHTKIFIIGRKSSKYHRNPRLYTVHMDYFFIFVFF